MTMLSTKQLERLHRKHLGHDGLPKKMIKRVGNVRTDADLVRLLRADAVLPIEFCDEIGVKAMIKTMRNYRGLHPDHTIQSLRDGFMVYYWLAPKNNAPKLSGKSSGARTAKTAPLTA